MSAWKALLAHRLSLNDIDIRDLFKGDKDRFEKFHLELDGLLLDFSKHMVTEETLALLITLAKDCGLEDWRDRMFAGEKINESEGRAVLHTALRGSVDPDLTIDGENVAHFVNNALSQIQYQCVRAEKAGYTDVVNIGIGGSDLGPHMVCDALKAYALGPRVHFISNIDGAQITGLLETLDPETTLFIIAS